MKRLLLFVVILIIIVVGMLKLIGNTKTDNGLSGGRNAQDGIQESNIPANENPKEIQKEFGQALSAVNTVLIDNASGEILFEKSCMKKCFPASTTKILTALVAIENGNPNETVTVGDEANFPAPGSSIAGIRYGEKLTLRQLLNCMLIPSGNDAAYVIARYIGEKTSGKHSVSNREAVDMFCRLMNRKAKEIGAKDSNFISPDGFHNPDHYTTAYDMSLIAKEAMKHKEFREIVMKTQFRLPDIKVKNKDGKIHNQTRNLVNTNKLLLPEDENYYAGTTGIKTGHTDEAGYCLVSSAEYNGKGIIAVVMNSTENEVWSDSKKLLKWGLE